MTALDTALRGDRLLPLWLLYVASGDVPVRVHTGAANLKLGPSGPDASGGTYLGLGLVLSIPNLRLPVNGAAAAHEFALSGVAAEAIRLVEADKDAVRGAACAIARLEMKPDMTPVAAPQWLWRGWVDSPRLTRSGRTIPATYTLSLLVSNGQTTRRRRELSFYTGPQQRLRSANDAACDGTHQLAAGTSHLWPNGGA